jgi:hypothetical protein
MRRRSSEPTGVQPGEQAHLRRRRTARSAPCTSRSACRFRRLTRRRDASNEASLKRACMDRASCACACPMHGHGHGSSRHTAYCATSSATSPTNPTPTPPLCDLVRRCLRLCRLPCTRRRARRGADHNG